MIPSVHLNGTGRQTLIDGYEKAYQSLGRAIEDLTKVEFHPRDYYVQGDDAWQRARAERDEQLTALRSVRSDIETILMEIVQ